MIFSAPQLVFTEPTDHCFDLVNLLLVVGMRQGPKCFAQMKHFTHGGCCAHPQIKKEDTAARNDVFRVCFVGIETVLK